jgi:hypothetical protein
MVTKRAMKVARYVFDFCFVGSSLSSILYLFQDQSDDESDDEEKLRASLADIPFEVLQVVNPQCTTITLCPLICVLFLQELKKDGTVVSLKGSRTKKVKFWFLSSHRLGSTSKNAHAAFEITAAPSARSAEMGIHPSSHLLCSQ